MSILSSACRSKAYATACLFLLCFTIYGQAPVISSVSPSIITQRSSVTLTGSQFTGATSVKFGSSAATSFTVVSDTQIIATAGSGASGVVTVTNASGTGTGAAITYIAAAATPASAAVTQLVSDFNGYWISSATSAVAANQPDTRHNLAAFTYSGTMYSTGVNNSMLSSHSLSFTTGDFRALPINAITGNTSAAASSNYIALGTKVDGDAATANYLAPTVSGLKIRDVLIDGIKGLDLGTGVTNISSSMVLDFSVSNVVESTITDGQPDIVVTQVASPSTTVDIYTFTDSSGNIIGTPMQANLNSIAAIGTYKLDLFTLPTNTPYSTATPNGNGAANGTRDIRMIAFKLSDFGITAANAGSVARFKVMPGGDSDPAFIAYNAAAFLIPAPVITVQPVSQVVCPNTSGSVTFSVTATGIGLSYQWRKNGIDITGATAASYTINNVITSDAASYTVIVSNPSGSVISDPVYLNAVTTVNPSPAVTCINSATSLSVSASGATVSYQWYSNTVNNNTTGTIISGATSATYSPPVSAAGIKYYYAVITANGLSCTATSTAAASVTVNAASVGGTASGAQTICSGSTATMTVSGYTGSIQWQQSANGTSGWANVTGGTGANAASYTSATLGSTTYFRVSVTNGVCSSSNSNVIMITVSIPSNAGTISAGQSVCYGTPATVTVSGAIGNIQWQQSADGLTGWTNVSTGTGAQTASYNTGNLNVATYYRAAVKSGNCPEVYSAPAFVNIPSTAWNGTSWSNGVPTITTAAFITGDFTATASLNACSLTISNNAVVNIPGGFNVNLYGAITVTSGSFTLESNANLVQQTAAVNSGNITVKRASIPLMRLDYILWSAPVSGQNLLSYSPLTVANRFYTYTPSTDTYSVVPSPSTTDFLTGKSYLIRMPNTHPTTPTAWTGSFTGAPHNGDIFAPVETGKYNAIGNPYPSAISANAFMAANNIDALYFWRKTNNTLMTSYATYTLAGGTGTGPNGQGDPNQLVPNGIISTGQGFIVHAASPSINFTNAMRMASNTNQFFRAMEDRSRIWLNLTGDGGIFSQALVAYMDDATMEADALIDGINLNTETTLTSLIGGTAYSVQGRSAFDATDVVPLGFKAIAAGNYTIGLDHSDGLFSNNDQPVYLKDKSTQSLTDLRTGSYAFASEAGTFNERFEIVYATPLAVTAPILTENAVVVYKHQDEIVINTGNIDMQSVEIFDIRGRLIASRKNINTREAHFDALAMSQVLIVKVVCSDGTAFAKKIIN
ncbi:MAG TPA: T9SS sorting signal type C domain-containing protein [Flavobacterium sp.]|jgi:hypothetical protein